MENIKKTITVITPTFNEEQNIEKVYLEVKNIFRECLTCMKIIQDEASRDFRFIFSVISCK